VAGGKCPPPLVAPPKFWAVGKLSENLLVKEFASKNAKFEAENSQFGKN